MASSSLEGGFVREMALFASVPRQVEGVLNSVEHRAAAVRMLIRLTAEHRGSRADLERSAEALGLSEPLAELLEVVSSPDSE